MYKFARQDPTTLAMGPLVGLRVAASRYLWRLGPGWAVLAGALAAGVPLEIGRSLLWLVGAVLLADSAWGAVWMPLANATPDLAQENAAALPDSRPWRLPYLQPGSPAAQLLALLPEQGWHGVIAGAVLSLGLGLLLGLPALALTVLVLALSGPVLFLARWGAPSPLLYALLNVGLPWALGIAFAPRTAAWQPLTLAAALLGAGFTLLDWGGHRAVWSARGNSRGIWLGQAAVVAVLAVLRLPWTAGIVAALFMAPTLIALQNRAMAQTEESAPSGVLTQCGPWWWAALMVSALAMR